MALNLQTFKTRALTALFFAGIMLLGMLWNKWSFFLLFSVVHFGCWREYQQLIGRIDDTYQTITPFHRFGIMLAGWCLMLYATDEHMLLGEVPLHAIGFTMGLVALFGLPLIEVLFTRQFQLKNIFHSAGGLIYLSVSLALLIDIRMQGQLLEIDFGWIAPMVIVGSIWINDTMAYLVGSWIGKHPLSKISPKKTWEGTLGGIILSVAILTLIGYAIHSYAVSVFALLALITSVAGTLGDLLESKLKRMAGVKDSGRIMPGHGGFLDRFDSLLVAIPFAWLFLKLL
ncbi:MAG: phosphatidate cytidylyltransferase [Chitinophagaceae bacterium]